jgi:hypothetical protein
MSSNTWCCSGMPLILCISEISFLLLSASLKVLKFFFSYVFGSFMAAGDLQVIVLTCATLCPSPGFAGYVRVLLPASSSDI